MGIAWLVFRENVDRRLLLGAFAILAGAALLSWQGQASLDWGALLIAGACLCLGHRQQPDAQAFLGRSGADRHAQGAGRRRSQSDARLGAGRRIARRRDHPRGRHGRLSWLRREPRPVRARPAPSRDGAHGSLFLAGALHRRAALADAARRAADGPAADGGCPDGDWPMAASGERHEHEHMHEAMEHEHRHRHDEHHQHAHGPDDPRANRTPIGTGMRRSCIGTRTIPTSITGMVTSTPADAAF